MIRPTVPITVGALSALFLTIALAALMGYVALISGSTGARIMAVSDSNELGAETGFPLPRFVSLASNTARMRYGPGFEYDVKWVYRRKSHPLEVIAEFANWRKMRDHTGASGWMHHSLLSGMRTAVIAPWDEQLHMLLAETHASSSVVAKMEPGYIVRVTSCGPLWCAVSSLSNRYAGHVRRNVLWGVYPETAQSAQAPVVAGPPT